MARSGDPGRREEYGLKGWGNQWAVVQKEKRLLRMGLGVQEPLRDGSIGLGSSW